MRCVSTEGGCFKDYYSKPISFTIIAFENHTTCAVRNARTQCQKGGRSSESRKVSAEIASWSAMNGFSLEGTKKLLKHLTHSLLSAACLSLLSCSNFSEAQHFLSSLIAVTVPVAQWKGEKSRQRYRLPTSTAQEVPAQPLGVGTSSQNWPNPRGRGFDSADSPFVVSGA